MRCVLITTFTLYLLGNVFEVTKSGYDPDLQKPTDDSNELDTKSGITVEEHEVIFKYYNRNYKAGDRIFINNVTKDILKGWRRNTKCKVITHGWLSSEKSMAVEGIKNAYLEKTNYNIITVDWSESASWKAYPLPAYMTTQVGGIIARLIEELVKQYLVYLDDIHVIGHSLGAHVAGASGAAVKTGKIGRITGLDPAGPAFEFIHYATHNVLDSSDGNFVDIIHSAGGTAGFFDTMGHVDFYPNRGTPIQPGCLESNSVSSVTFSFSCSHARAYQYYADSIIHPHTYKAYKCETWEEFIKENCDDNPTVFMGDETPNTTRGVYYLLTKDKEPYGLEDGAYHNGERLQ